MSKPEEHDGPVRAISFYPDQSGTFVSIGADGKMRGRSWKSGVRNIDAHVGGGFSAVYSPDGSMVATSGGDKKLKLWQSGDFRLLRTFEGHTKYVLAAAFSRDGRMIASGGGDSTLILWDTQSGQVIRKFSGHESDIESVAFSADGTRLFSVSEDKTMWVWDVGTGRQLAIGVGFADGEYIACTPDGKYTGSAGGHSNVKLLQNGAERDLDSEHKARFFSPAGLAINSK